jgi:hypothetical protein
MKKQVNEMSLERAKVLFGREIDECKLKKLLEQVKAFCKVSYELYLKSIDSDKGAIVKQLEAEPPDEFTKAA